MAEDKRLVRKRTKKSNVSDIEKHLRLLLDTGKVILGTNKSIKALMLEDVKAIIYAENIPELVKESLLEKTKVGSIPAIKYNGTSLKLGKLCGKLFPVTIMAVKELGEADLEVLKGQ